MFPIYFLYMIQGTLPYLHVDGDPALRKRWKWKAGCILCVDTMIPYGHGTAPGGAHPPGISTKCLVAVFGLLLPMRFSAELR
jgi:hypothetical protein